MGESGHPFAFHDLPETSFPFVVEFFKLTDDTGRDPVHRITVDGPGIIEIPPLAGDGVKVWARITYADGTITETPRRTPSPSRRATPRPVRLTRITRGDRRRPR